MTTTQPLALADLWRDRPRNHFVRKSLWAMGALTLLVACTTDLSFGLNDRRLGNLQRFFFEDIIPEPLQGRDFDWGIALTWASERMSEGGWHAAWSTLAISIVAIVLAMGLALLFTLPAARNFANPEPFLPGPRPPTFAHRLYWSVHVRVSRTLLILMRAIPEYVWAFLLIAILGANPWPAILALALHNAGILGRLTSEVIENVDTKVPAALVGLGARRRQVTMFSLLPENFSRMLLYFFYRWETCVREATVLGMLGIASLGFLIQDAKVKLFYDEMFFLILVGAAIVILGDFVSLIAREVARR